MHNDAAGHLDPESPNYVRSNWPKHLQEYGMKQAVSIYNIGDDVDLH